MNPLAELIGESPGIAAVRETIRRLVQRQSDARRLPPVLIQGETGTGKGLVARLIHGAGPRADGPFVDVNCAAIPDTLLEAELFGFERGAFTDARQAKPGLFQTANRGTLFLDEVGLLPEGLQAKLLKAIEERAVRRLGSTRSEPVDVWILTATNEDLAAATRGRRFREDLYHRLAVVTVALPPLRERGQDVARLAEHFLARACADYSLPPKAFTPEARAALLAYSWPGNIRELANVMERVALLSEAALVTAEMLALPAPTAAEPGEPPPGPTAAPLEEALGSVERGHLLEALRETAWNITRAAARLGISRDTLRYRIVKHGLRTEGRQPASARRAARAAAPAAPPAPAREGPTAGTVRWDRRRLTLLRTGIQLPPGADPRLYPSRALEEIVEKVQSFGGRIEERGPTGIVAAFGLEPTEDAPRRAALAAMAIQKAADRAWPGAGERPAVRSAIHVGPFLVGQSGGASQIDFDGKRQAATILEALVDRAQPDTILASESAAVFLERRFDLVPAGGAPAADVRVWRVAGPERTGLEPGRRMATFVGRRQELELLQSRLAAAMRGHGQVVGILGEAGIGKSRLIFEFRRGLRGERVTWLEGRCQSYGSAVPYLPVFDILRQNFRLAETDSPEAITEKVRAGLRDVEMDPEEWAPYLLQLLGVKEGTEHLAVLTPGAIKSRTFEALRQMGLQSCRRRPLIFVFEDVHWIDQTSEECFSSLMESLVGAPALVVVTYRPGYRPPWVDKSYVTQVALQPLTPEDSLTVVRSILPTSLIPQPVAQLILQKAEGNPFFLEELSRAVGEAEDLPPALTVPDTVQEVLLARVERLPEEPKRLLQTASVLGREAPLPLLRALWGEAGDLDPQLRELTRVEFLYEQSGGAEPVYAFTHTLTQEVAYESLPLAQRQALHAAAGAALEQLYADRVEEAYDRLVYHYSKTEQADKAVEYLTRLADKAARGHAHMEAIRALDEAVGHAQRFPAEARDRRLLELALRQAHSLIPLGRFQEIVDLLLRHRESLERLGASALAGPYYFFLGRSYLFLGEDARAVESAERAIAEATRSQDEATLGKVHYMLAQRGPLSGYPRDGLEHGRRAVELLERAGEQWWIGPAHWAVGLNHAMLGEFDAALEAEERARAQGEAVEDPQVQSSAAWATGLAHASRGEWEAGVAGCRRSLELAPDPLNSVIALGWLGYAYLEQGDAERAIPVLEQSAQEVGAFHFPQLQGWFTLFLADAHRVAGHLDRAQEVAAQGLQMARTGTSLWGLGWAHRALGRIAQARGDLAAAEASLTEALRTFTAIEAGYDVARAHLDLAALAHARGGGPAATHIGEALRLFEALGLPRQAERARRLAADLNVPLPHVAEREQIDPA